MDQIDSGMFHSLDAKERLEELKLRPLDDDEEELFIAPRIVPERDQIVMFV